MSEPRRPAGPPTGFGPVHLLVLVAVAELSITRLAVPVLRPGPRVKNTPLWFEVLDNAGLFLLYFGTTLAVAVLAMRAIELVRSRDQPSAPTRIGRSWLAAVLLGCAALAALNVASQPSDDMSFALQTAWALALLSVVVAVVLRRHDLGVAIGLVVIAIPLLVHYYAAFNAHIVLSEDELLDGSLIERAQGWGLDALVLAALITPYCFAPRPVIRSVTRVSPLGVALLIGGLGAVLVRREYEAAIRLASYGVGVDLGPGVPSDDMAMYLLAMATLGWTLASCTIAPSEARRDVGLGLGLIILGGYGFVWPFHFLISVVGFVVIADAASRLRDEETPRGIRPRTPAIDDDAWQAWVNQLVAALRKDDPGEIKTVTARGDDDTSTSVVVGERHGVPFKLRLGRMSSALVSIDLVCGRELSDTMRATFTLYARPEGNREAHPAPPPAAPTVNLDDLGFTARFRVRGDQAQVLALLDEPLRSRAAALLDGWLAWWQGESLRYRVYPAVGAPLDHPVPLSDLSTRAAGTVERMAGVVDLLTTIAARGLPAHSGAPELLD